VIPLVVAVITETLPIRAMAEKTPRAKYSVAGKIRGSVAGSKTSRLTPLGKMLVEPMGFSRR
jgi:hypothetical protein